jgi:hypothetical protein
MNWDRSFKPTPASPSFLGCRLGLSFLEWEAFQVVLDAVDVPHAILMHRLAQQLRILERVVVRVGEAGAYQEVLEEIVDCVLCHAFEEPIPEQVQFQGKAAEVHAETGERHIAERRDHIENESRIHPNVEDFGCQSDFDPHAAGRDEDIDEGAAFERSSCDRERSKKIGDLGPERVTDLL